MAASQLDFSPRQIAEALNVSESSVKRWCDSDTLGNDRTVGGHRRITVQQLLDFLGKTGKPLVNPKSLGLRGMPLASESRMPLPSPIQKAFFDAIMAGDEDESFRIIQDYLDEGHRASETLQYLLTDTMHRFGEAWDCGTAQVYQERRACDICMRLIQQLRFATRKPKPDAPIAIGGALAGDPYQLPTAMVELTFRETGWAATSLGCDLPVDTLLQAATDYQTRVLWVSVSTYADEVSLQDDFR
ncbi:MAG: B12-binding domain-containing protein, partial [Planctomycetota bacterium]